MHYWYAVYVRSQWERRVAAELERRGIDTYLPLIHTATRWSDRTKQAENPAFPGYVFVRATAERVAEVLWTTGTVHILGIGSTPEAIPDEQIEAVRRVLAFQAAAGTVRHLPALRPGMAVRIVAGPLEGIEGICDHIARRCRVRVLLPLLHQSIPAEVGLDELEIVTPRRIAA
jgi:transcription antitermination factor NusG